MGWFDDLEKDLDMWAAIEAGKDRDGNINPFTAAGFFGALGYDTSEEQIPLWKRMALLGAFSKGKIADYKKESSFRVPSINIDMDNFEEEEDDEDYEDYDEAVESVVCIADFSDRVITAIQEENIELARQLFAETLKDANITDEDKNDFIWYVFSKFMDYETRDSVERIKFCETYLLPILKDMPGKFFQDLYRRNKYDLRQYIRYGVLDD